MRAQAQHLAHLTCLLYLAPTPLHVPLTSHPACAWLPPRQGWRYLKADRADQSYKEGAVLLQQAQLQRIQNPIEWEGKPLPLACPS